MKRSQIKRSTKRLARKKGIPPSKKPMPKKSEKQTKLERDTYAMRHAAIDFGTLCECCCEVIATEPHEITAGAHRHRAMREPLAQMMLCRRCHEAVQGEPYEFQIAIKCRSIIKAVNRCARDHGGEAVGLEDVRRCL